MRKKFLKKVSLLSLTAFMLGSIAVSAAGKGENTKAQFYQGVIKEQRTNTTLDYAYRDTEKKSDPFYVKLDYSNEDDENFTVTRFWLENGKGDNLCNTVDVTLGKGYYAQNTYQSACGKRVYLTAENNNWDSNVYRISGYWIEE